jgi:hypothetical protein
MTLPLPSTPNAGDGLDSAARILNEYYRCPSSLLPFLPSKAPTSRPGYFRLGQNTICYGRLAGANAAETPDGELHDALNDADVAAEGIRLPFQADEIIENLRRERYSPHVQEEGSTENTFVRKLYYFLRPWLSVGMRRHLQKIRLKGWDKIPFPRWPVDFTVERIHQKLLLLAMQKQNLSEVPFIWFWPKGYKNCAILTHDVEEAPGRDFCPKLMDLDESYGFRSSFQVVPESRYAVPKSYLDGIVNRGFEVNIHDLRHDGNLFTVQEEFRRRAKLINQYVKDFGAKGFRSGVLYRNAEWLESLQVAYDMSIPNVAHLDPQRGGCCTVMPYFIQDIVELPVTCTQDYTLFYILGADSIDLWKEQIALLQANHGLISIIAHPDYVMQPEVDTLYRALLAHLAELRTRDRMWTPLPGEVAEWWRERSQTEMVFEGGEWRLEGPGKERAAIAYACRTGDTLTYRFS